MRHMGSLILPANCSHCVLNFSVNFGLYRYPIYVYLLPEQLIGQEFWDALYVKIPYVRPF